MAQYCGRSEAGSVYSFASGSLCITPIIQPLWEIMHKEIHLTEQFASDTSISISISPPTCYNIPKPNMRGKP